MRAPLVFLRDLYRRLPEGIRYCVRPLNALDEASTYLPAGGRGAVQRFVGGVKSMNAHARGRLVRLSGASAIDGHPLDALVDLGREGEAFWGGLLFAAPPTRTLVEESRSRIGVPPADGLDADLVLLRHHRFARGAARRAGYVAIPSWVETYIDTRGTFEDVIARGAVHKKTLKSDLKRIRRGDLRASIGSRDEVATFLREMYEPITRARWGASCVLLPDSSMRQASRFCEVLWIEHHGERVGGALLEPRGRELRSVVIGLGDVSDPYGVRNAHYYFAIRHAVARGYQRLVLGGCRPVLSNGVLRVKRKWGAVLRTTLQWDYLALALPRGPQALRGLLATHPLVAEMDGRLYAVVDPAAHKEPWMPGLAGAIVPGAGGWETRPLGRAHVGAVCHGGRTMSQRRHTARPASPHSL